MRPPPTWLARSGPPVPFWHDQEPVASSGTLILRDVPFGENREPDVCRVVIEPSLIVTLMAVSGWVPRGTSPPMSPP
jgi:hypothetical protein